MREYINSILPRIKQFSESLDKKAILIEQPWVFINDEGNFEKLIFKKNQELIMSLNGIVTMGRWEYLPSAKSLLIDRNTNKILLNQEFIEKALLVLKYDGFSDKYFVLANENIIPDLDVESYLRRIFYSQYHIGLIESTDDKTYEIVRQTDNEFIGRIGQSVLENAKTVNEVSFKAKDSNINYHIKNGKIYKMSENIDFKTLDGKKLVVESFFEYNYERQPKKGDIVRLNKYKFAPDGIYRLSRFKKIKVENGIIV
jgi:hypothetical protein